MFDEKFWVAAAFVIFVALVTPKMWPAITSRLDARSQRIRDELDEAVRLREEAQALLSQYQRQQRDAEQEAQAIIDQAQAEAKQMIDAAERRLDEQMIRREQMAKDKIAQTEAEAVAALRAAAADIAVDAATDVIRQQLDAARADDLIEHAISDLGNRLN